CRALSQFEDELRGGKRGGGAGLGDIGHQVGLGQPALADVDADLERRLGRKLELPAPPVGARLSKYPALQRADHPDLLSQLKKISGSEQAATRMIPPQEGLEPDDRPVAEPNRRLIVERELTPFQRVRAV